MNFWHKLYITGTVIAVCLAATISAKGQEMPMPTPAGQCGPRTALLEALGKEYHEIPLNYGLGDDGMVYELLVSPDSWTIIGTRPNGAPGQNGLISCVKAAGSSPWMTYPAPAKGA